MDGIHDMGGTQGWGTVVIDPDEPVFAEPWEARAFASALLSTRPSGHQPRRVPPRHSTASTRTTTSPTATTAAGCDCAETLLVDSGVIAPGAVEARARKLRGEDVEEPAEPEPNKPDYQPTAAGSLREVDDAAGVRGRADRVRAKDMQPPGHTRLPRYVRGPRGRRRRASSPGHVLPDTHAHFVGRERAARLHGRFDSPSCGAPDAEPFDLTIDLYESYLEPA